MPLHMNTSLDHLPPRKQAELARITEILFDEFDQAQAGAAERGEKKARILRVILFGSHATGTWVEDARPTGGYFSDYDILVVVDDETYLSPAVNVWHRCEERFEVDPRIATPVSLITESWQMLNTRLAEGHFFYSDIVAQGIELFALKGKVLATKKANFAPGELLAIAEEHYGEWMPAVGEFLIAYEALVEAGAYKRAAFLLHQAAESAYAAVLTVVGNYLPNTHNLTCLRSLSENLDRRLIPVWPRETKADDKPFQRLKEAYVKARYSKHWSITKEELNLLRERVLDLQHQADAACKSRLGNLKPLRKGDR